MTLSELYRKSDTTIRSILESVNASKIDLIFEFIELDVKSVPFMSKYEKEVFLANHIRDTRTDKTIQNNILTKYNNITLGNY